MSDNSIREDHDGDQNSRPLFETVSGDSVQQDHTDDQKRRDLFGCGCVGLIIIVVSGMIAASILSIGFQIIVSLAPELAAPLVRLCMDILEIDSVDQALTVISMNCARVGFLIGAVLGVKPARAKGPKKTPEVGEYPASHP